MPRCPKCGAEYIEGFTKCRDCGIELVEELIDKDEESKDAQFEPITRHREKVLLVTIDDVTQYSYIKSMLICEGIVHWVLEHGVDNNLTRTCAISVYPKYIYVSEYDLERAKEIVDSYMPEENTEDGEWKSEGYDEQVDDEIDGRLRFRPQLMIIGVGFIASWLIFYVISIIK